MGTKHMRIAYIECFSGISGDMTVGAVLHAGVSEELLQQAVAALKIGAELRIRRIDRNGIFATKFDVLVNGELADRADDSAHVHPHEHEHHMLMTMLTATLILILPPTAIIIANMVL